MLLELSLTGMHIKGMMEHIDLQEEQKMRLEEENIISMTMTEMEILEMTRIGSKNHKGMNSRNQSRMSSKT